MKLSDAMEAGWEIAPRSWDSGWGQTNLDGTWAGVCALGAAYLGYHPEAKNTEFSFHNIWNNLPHVQDKVDVSGLPKELWEALDNGRIESIGAVAETMNDTLHWPKQKIIETVRSLGY